MRFWALLVCVALAVLTIRPAHARTRVEVLGTWPAGGTVTLGRQQTFYLHLRYHSDRPTRIWVQPYGDAGPISAGSNPSRVYPAGEGDALVWFFLMKSGEHATGVRIRAGDGSIAGTHEVANYPVDVYAGDQPVTTGAAAPEWVTRLSRADKVAQDAAYRNAMNQPFTAADVLLFYGFMLLAAALGIFGVASPAWGLWRWRGGWRAAAALPAAIMAFVILRLLVDTARDPTSHNLWPFEIVMAGGACSVIMIVLIVARKLSGAGRTF